ncbi:MAG: aminoglycoside phosphotransferase family protein [Lachnospiraceae bacterium]|jgi:hypothetical protein|nr:aminoglycoside phosphotransferase family protein [Lachnospiraceae bacterium]MCI1657043.1 aminoglycoside phosphotransferase family protein [Lachnospiraceae bacterium]MCI2195532.1 aminoglycoside phosphotransferase family protein [Lachnospiraceae bacterium]
MIKFNEIMNKFQVEGEVTQVEPLGHGRVNHTFEVVCGGRHYVLQEINHMIFKYPIDVVNNLFLVTEYMRKQIAREGGDPERETLTFLRTKDENQLLQTDDGGYFRLYRMIDRGVEMKKPRTPAEAFEAAAAIGKFQHELIGFPAEQLSVTFPEMHNMKKRIRALLDAVRADICMRTSNCQEQIHFVLDRADRLYAIEDAVRAGAIPKRVTHNDPGYNNILLDQDTGKALCLIDLDTVMSGASVNDFGDAVRMGAASVTEFERDGDVELDLKLYRAYLEGYLYYMGAHLNQEEKDFLGESVWLAAMERGIRYLTDYLNGGYVGSDFSDEKEYLYCAVNQFYLVLDMEEKQEQMEEILREVLMSAE